MFLAEDVPSLGYRRYCVDQAPGEQAQAAASASAAPPWTSPFSNAHFRLTPGLGGLASVVDIATGAERELGPERKGTGGELGEKGKGGRRRHEQERRHRPFERRD